MSWKPGEIVGGVFGALAALPFGVYGFILGGTFIGAATGGVLAIPGALFGAGLAILAGAFAGAAISRASIALVRHFLSHKARPDNSAVAEKE
jgi:hypothetical protein